MDERRPGFRRVDGRGTTGQTNVGIERRQRRLILQRDMIQARFVAIRQDHLFQQIRFIDRGHSKGWGFDMTINGNMIVRQTHEASHEPIQDRAWGGVAFDPIRSKPELEGRGLRQSNGSQMIVRHDGDHGPHSFNVVMIFFQKARRGDPQLALGQTRNL